MQLDTYLSSPVIQTSYDMTSLIGPKYNYLPELGLEGCVNTKSLNALKNQQRLKFIITHKTKRATYYYQDTLGWKLGYLTYLGKPIAVLRAQQDFDPFPSRFVLDEVEYRLALSFLFSLLVKEPVSPLEPRGEPRSGTIATQLLDTFPYRLDSLEESLDFSIQYIL